MRRARILRSISVVAGLMALGATWAQLSYGIWQVTDTKYSSKIPTPVKTSGFVLGSRHTYSWEINDYFRSVAAASDRVVVRSYGRTHEGRELIYAVVTSPENHKNFNRIIEQNRRLVNEPETVSDAELAKMPLVYWSGHGVHGDEASGPEAALAFLYHLAADESAEMKKTLHNTVIFLFPNYNPDGRDRFVSWVNGNRGAIATFENADREHNQPWPGGRTNHYWFDLNRDWFPLTQPESQGRHELLRAARPQLILDYHEMGGESYFFQPGVQSRVNPLTPKSNQELTKEIARYHAKALERIGQRYFTEQRYDDFYIGKGSTYPDVIGSIGILFEQGSTRGLIRKGEEFVHYEATVRNQFATCLSSLQAGQDMRAKLLKHQRDFFRTPVLPTNGVTYYRIKRDSAGMKLVNNVLAHQVKVMVLNGDFIVPVSQRFGTLVKAMFEPRTTFEDTQFYDISAWSLMYTTEATVTEGRGEISGARELQESDFAKKDSLIKADKPIGYIIRKESPNFHELVNYTMPDGRHYFVKSALGNARPGDVFVLIENENLVLNKALRGRGDLVEMVGGQTGEIVSWGGNQLTLVEQPKIALIAGSGTDSNNTGEQWWELDHEHSMEVSVIDASSATQSVLANYNVVLLAGGRYPAPFAETLSAWVSGGGTLVATAGGAEWVAGTTIWKLDSKSVRSDFEGLSYGELEAARGEHTVPGTIFETVLDKTHPLTFGCDRTSSFRESGSFWVVPKEAGVTVSRYTDSPLLAGYVSPKVLETSRGSAAVLAKRMGGGRVVLMADNPVFRGFMSAQRRLWLNAIFFSRAF